MVHQIGEYTDNGHVVRVFSAAYAGGLGDNSWFFPTANTYDMPRIQRGRNKEQVKTLGFREHSVKQINFN